MKTCPYCQEEVKDGATKCRYCQSALEAQESDSSVTYVIDRDLIRFAKFSLSVLGIFVLVGAFLYGFDLKKAADEIRVAQKASESDRHLIEETKQKIIQLKTDIDQRAQEAITTVNSLKKQNVEFQTIIDSSKIAATSDERATQLLQSSLSAYFNNILTPEQIAKLQANFKIKTILSSNHKYTEQEVLQLITQDVRTIFDYFHSRGFTIPIPRTEIHPAADYMNTYWDGKKLVFGMGMVNSDLFGPYDSSLVFHEMTHSLFNLSFEGQSGAVSESICDVMAVIVRGTGWTVGSVRTTSGPSQSLRSLQAPGTAFNSPTLGKDPQVDHMSRYVKTTADNGGIHINDGILNKAAYLISEGGHHGGVDIPKGIGRQSLGILYLEVIKRLPKDGTMSFPAFRDLVIDTARGSIGTQAADIAKLAFKAVGV